MMTSSEFADVTIVTDDKQQTRAHRNILSACSPVFKHILQLDSKNSNTVIYLRGIQHSEMESIMQFIYMGKARFYEERMSELFMVSKNLEIKELVTSLQGNDQTYSNEERNDSKDIFSGKDFDDFENSTTTVNEDQKSQYVDIKYVCKQCNHEAATQSSLRKHFQSSHEGVKSAQGSPTHHINLMHGGVEYACDQCDYQATQQGNLKRHIQSIHEGVRYACKQCDNQYSERRSLKLHIQFVHEGIKYDCNQCNYQAPTMRHLRLHFQSKHEGVKHPCNHCDYKASAKSRLKGRPSEVPNPVTP